MSANHRFIKFWPQDWQRDPALRSCGVAARGMWIDMLCIMHEGEPYGHLTVNGKAMTNRQIGLVIGCGEKDAGKLIRELEEAGVFNRTEDGTIYSRRMVRDCEQSDTGRQGIEKRWGKSDGKSRSQRLKEAREKGQHSEDEWRDLCEIFEYRCVKCGKRNDTVKDHIVPIYMGGSDSIDNIQPMCLSCNAAKSSDTTDYRDKASEGWRDAFRKRLGPLDVRHQETPRETPSGPSHPTSSLEYRIKNQKQEPPLYPPPGGMRRPYRNGFLTIIEQEGMPSQEAGGETFIDRRLKLAEKA